MSGILDLINSDLGKQIIGNITEKTGVNAAQATAVVTNGLPEILGKMQQNAATGDSGLMGALLGGKHDGSILDNIGGFLNGGDFSDGKKILGHVLGGDQDNMIQGLSSKTGVDSSIISKILPMLAPIVMGYLGKQVQNKGVQSSGGLGDLLGGLLGGANQAGGSSVLTSVLDQNGDGKLDISDAMSALSGNKKKSGGLLGGLLGGLFGKK